jgi:hypothetical protein
MGDNERIMSATVKQKTDLSMSPGATLEKDHLTPEVKIANEIICDHVWNKLLPPISVNCSKWYKENPFCSWGSAFGLEYTELLLACLINLLPKSFSALSLSEPSCYISGALVWDLEGSVFTLLPAQHLQPAKRPTLPGATRSLDLRKPFSQ